MSCDCEGQVHGVVCLLCSRLCVLHGPGRADRHPKQSLALSLQNACTQRALPFPSCLCTSQWHPASWHLIHQAVLLLLQSSHLLSLPESALQAMRSIGPHIVGKFCEIVKLRNRLAKVAGFEDYYDMKVSMGWSSCMTESAAVIKALAAMVDM